MSTELMINSAAFKGVVPNEAFAALNPSSESLADGIGSSYAVVGYKGKVWTLRYRGEKYTFVRADDGSPSAFLDVIVLRSAGVKSKSYYPAGTFSDASSDGARPTCASLDGVTPDSDVLEKQASACAICPRNEWKLNAEGRKGRECSDYKRLAVLILPNLTKAVLGTALMEPAFLRIPAASLNDLALLGETMAGQGFHFSTYITRIGFMADKPHPQMTFRALQPLTAKEAPVVLPMREDPLALRITGEAEIARGHTQVAHQPVKTVEPEKVDTGIMAAAEEPKTVVQPKTEPKTIEGTVNPVEKPKPDLHVVKTEPEQVDAGFGDLDTPLEAAAPKEPTVQTVEDTGEPDVADSDMDARIAALLKSN